MIRKWLNRIRRWQRRNQPTLRISTQDAGHVVTVPLEPVPADIGRYTGIITLRETGWYRVRLVAPDGSNGPSYRMDLPPGAAITSISFRERYTDREWPVDIEEAPDA